MRNLEFSCKFESSASHKFQLFFLFWRIKDDELYNAIARDLQGKYVLQPGLVSF